MALNSFDRTSEGPKPLKTLEVSKVLKPSRPGTLLKALSPVKPIEVPKASQAT